MTRGGVLPLRLPVALAAVLICCGSAVPAGQLRDALALYRQGRWADARAILAPIVASEPTNAEAYYLLGMVTQRAGGASALETSREMLGRAVKLAPKNPTYLAEYAGVCLLLADRDNSLGMALEGRDSMTQAVAENPSDLEAREALVEFYAKAPWPIGDVEKAMEQAAEIAKRDPKRGIEAYREMSAIFDKDGRRESAAAAERAAQRLAQPRAQ